MAPHRTVQAARSSAVSKPNKPMNGDHSTRASRGQDFNTRTNSAAITGKRQGVRDDIDRRVKRAKAHKAVNSPPTDRLHVLVFGNGESGELGLGAEITKQSPDSAETPRLNHLLNAEQVGVTQIAVGGMHCAVLTHDGSVMTWGVNDSQALGRHTQWTAPDDLPDNMTDLNPLESTPTVVKSLDDIDGKVVQVAACDNATFILTSLGSVYGWGTFFGNYGAFGFLKEQAASRKQLFQTKPVRVPGLPIVKELAAGVNHMLALTHDGNVYSWGSGQQAELGRRIVSRRKEEALFPRPIALPKKGVIKVFAGFNHSFAIDKHGSVWSWGLNNFGQTGHHSDEEHLHIDAPEVVESLKDYNIQQIAGGFHHSLACTDNGEVLAWGRCDDKQLGLDLTTIPEDNILLDSRGCARIVTKPVKVPGLSAYYVAAGIDNSFAIDKAGKVFAWGFSDNFRTGLKTDDAVERPTPLMTKAMAGMTFSFAGCRGQFSVIAGPAKV